MEHQPYCAVCKQKVDPAERHVSIIATTKDPRDRNKQDDYCLHYECAESVTNGWMEPL